MLHAPPLPDGRPDAYTLPGTRAAAVLVHGYTSTPWELRPTADVLSAHGVAAHGVLLPGHGTVPGDMVGVSRRQWVETVRRAFFALDPDQPRFLVASSMGALLALLVAQEVGPLCAGLVLYGPALDLFPSGVFGGMLARIAEKRGVDDIPKAERGGDIGDAEARAINPAYDVLPLDGLAEFDRLRGEARAALKDVRVPVLVLHGALDRTVRPSSSRAVIAGVRAPYVERELLVHSRHVIGVDLERHHVAERTRTFIDRVLRRAEGEA